MSFLSSLFGGGGGQAAGHSVQYVESEIPEYIQEPTERMLERAENLSLEDYVGYEGERIAGLQPDELSALDRARSELGVGPMLQDVAYGTVAGTTGPITQAQIQGAMDPYQNLVTQDVIDEMNRQQQIKETQYAAQAVGAGAFGGGRFGVGEAEMAGLHSRATGDLLNRMRSQNYQQAVDQILKTRAADREAASTMGQLAMGRQTAGLTDIASEQGIGRLLRGEEQRGLDIAYEDFLSQRAYPYEQVGFLQNVIRGAPFTTNTTTTTDSTRTVPGPSPFQQLAGLGLGAFGMWKAFGS